jgi:hypothetical protein
MGATNRPDSIDPALRRGGRFDREIAVPIPNLQQRENILNVLCKPLRIDGEFSIKNLAQKTPGYVGADLTALVRCSSLFGRPIPPLLEDARHLFGCCCYRMRYIRPLRIASFSWLNTESDHASMLTVHTLTMNSATKTLNPATQC